MWRSSHVHWHVFPRDFRIVGHDYFSQRAADHVLLILQHGNAMHVVCWFTLSRLPRFPLANQSARFTKSKSAPIFANSSAVAFFLKKSCRFCSVCVWFPAPHALRRVSLFWCLAYLYSFVCICMLFQFKEDVAAVLSLHGSQIVSEYRKWQGCFLHGLSLAKASLQHVN